MLCEGNSRFSMRFWMVVPAKSLAGGSGLLFAPLMGKNCGELGLAEMRRLSISWRGPVQCGEWLGEAPVEPLQGLLEVGSASRAPYD